MAGLFVCIVRKILLKAVMLAFISMAQAQGYVVQSPGHSPAYAIPGPNGTYIVQSEGHRPAYAIPGPNGTYVIPGQRHNPTLTSLGFL